MNVPEKIYELVKTLPEPQVSEVLDFVEFLQHKLQNTTTTSQPPSLPNEAPTEQKNSVSQTSFPDLQPLPVLDGYVPQGWKDATYE
ncbi:DUF2281 domain-containing protein [Gloeobacter violaceus]|uniref:Gsl4205 protein n=1 Tax=Gloeobacter violaceus (strain ATCC 29082 / PCC 7421) TaxID=251221 RepID=Q7NDN0_GLOVI|nr:DUF2281 domain-containing protein [Gloeobacter violaceus]BAC92146.1 gsl4205 [Gloeobacter violaceus PCC 7421]